MKLRYIEDVALIGNFGVKTLETVKIQGKEYEVITDKLSKNGPQHYFVEVKVLGTMRRFDLMTVEVPVTVLKYTLDK